MKKLSRFTIMIEKAMLSIDMHADVKKLLTFVVDNSLVGTYNITQKYLMLDKMENHKIFPKTSLLYNTKMRWGKEFSSVDELISCISHSVKINKTEPKKGMSPKVETLQLTTPSINGNTITANKATITPTKVNGLRLYKFTAGRLNDAEFKLYKTMCKRHQGSFDGDRFWCCLADHNFLDKYFLTIVEGKDQQIIQVLSLKDGIDVRTALNETTNKPIVDSIPKVKAKFSKSNKKPSLIPDSLLSIIVSHRENGLSYEKIVELMNKTTINPKTRKKWCTRTLTQYMSEIRPDLRQVRGKNHQQLSVL